MLLPKFSGNNVGSGLLRNKGKVIFTNSDALATQLRDILFLLMSEVNSTTALNEL